MSFEEEWANMLAGRPYDAAHPGFGIRLMETRTKLHRFNSLAPDNGEEMEAILRGLFGSCGANLHVNQPLRVDYGCNIHIGDDVFINFNLTVLDEAEVRIGSRTLIGPNVSIYTACHPIDVEQRDAAIQWARPVTIGESVWIGGNSVILPGVTIHDGAVVGAGSVVTRDVPPGTVVAGNPARIIR